MTLLGGPDDGENRQENYTVRVGQLFLQKCQLFFQNVPMPMRIRTMYLHTSILISQ